MYLAGARGRNQSGAVGGPDQKMVSLYEGATPTRCARGSPRGGVPLCCIQIIRAGNGGVTAGSPLYGRQYNGRFKPIKPLSHDCGHGEHLSYFPA